MSARTSRHSDINAAREELSYKRAPPKHQAKLLGQLFIKYHLLVCSRTTAEGAML